MEILGIIIVVVFLSSFTSIYIYKKIKSNNIEILLNAKSGISSGDYKKAGELYEKKGLLKEATEMYIRAKDYKKALICLNKFSETASKEILYNKLNDIGKNGDILDKYDNFELEENFTLSDIEDIESNDDGLSLSSNEMIMAVPIDPNQEGLEPFLAMEHSIREKVAANKVSLSAKTLMDTNSNPIKESSNSNDKGTTTLNFIEEIAKVPIERTSFFETSSSRYTIISELGKGGVGTVYLARDKILGRYVAYKIFSLDFKNNPKAFKILMKEAKVTAGFNHQNIVTLFDIGRIGDTFFLSMEYVEGKSLKRIIDEEVELSLTQQINIFRQICRALNYAHKKKVIHLDVKPANIMYSEAGKIVKLMDFGISKVLQDTMGGQSLIMFTPHYVAPEQIKGLAVDCRTDIYSLGISMFELVTGKLPFSRGDYLYHHIHTNPIPPIDLRPNIPKKLNDIIMRCIEKKPEDRYSSVKDILFDLDQFEK